MAHVEWGKVLELDTTVGHMGTWLSSLDRSIPCSLLMVPLLFPPRSENLGANGV